MMHRTIITLLTSALLAATALCGDAPKKERKPAPRVSKTAAKKISEAVPRKATARPAKPRKMLVLSYQSHNAGRFASEYALELMAKRTGAFEAL